MNRVPRNTTPLLKGSALASVAVPNHARFGLTASAPPVVRGLRFHQPGRGMTPVRRSP
jgi:hypothetical protein